MNATLANAIDIATVFLLAAGCFFVLLGSLALVKLSSFFHRIHGPTKASTLGVGCILVASILYHTVHGVGMHPRELLITVFLFLTAPVAAHLMSRAALSLMQGRPQDPSTTPDPEGHIRDDADERADRRAREEREAQEAADKLARERETRRNG
jgi:multicomponent K+:H+ antiporter subunit G